MSRRNIGLFVPHLGCPHRCSFCNQHTISGTVLPPTPEQVDEACALAAVSGAPNETEIAFFGGSFTAIPFALQRSLLEAATRNIERYGFAGIRLSTRPDAVGPEQLQLLRPYPVTTIELGVQSLQDSVLRQNRRGHTASQAAEGAVQVRQAGYQLILQMMTGLVGDDDQGTLDTACRLSKLSPQGIRIYPTLVLEGTFLAQLWREKKYCPQTMEQAVSLCARLLSFFQEKEIPVIRLGLHASRNVEEALLAGPYHPAFRELCESRLFFEKAVAALSLYPRNSAVCLTVHPTCRSKLVGQKKENLLRLKQLGYSVQVTVSDSLSPGQVTAADASLS